MNSFGILMVCLVDADWNQLSDWRRVDYPAKVTFEKKSTRNGIAVGYLVRHLPTNMVSFSPLDTRVHVAKLDSIELHLTMPAQPNGTEY